MEADCDHTAQATKRFTWKGVQWDLLSCVEVQTKGWKVVETIACPETHNYGEGNVSKSYERDIYVHSNLH